MDFCTEQHCSALVELLLTFVAHLYCNNLFNSISWKISHSLGLSTNNFTFANSNSIFEKNIPCKNYFHCFWLAAFGLQLPLNTSATLNGSNK